MTLCQSINQSVSQSVSQSVNIGREIKDGRTEGLTGAAEEGGGVVEGLEVRVLQEPGEHHADAAAHEAHHEGA